MAAEDWVIQDDIEVGIDVKISNATRVTLADSFCESNKRWKGNVMIPSQSHGKSACPHNRPNAGLNGLARSLRIRRIGIEITQIEQGSVGLAYDSLACIDIHQVVRVC
jgi:hypothetical protein